MKSQAMNELDTTKKAPGVFNRGDEKIEPPKFPDGTPLPKKTETGFPVGEGSYEGTKGYEKRMDKYMKTADIEADAEAAKPDSAADARELRAAEAEAASRTKTPGE